MAAVIAASHVISCRFIIEFSGSHVCIARGVALGCRVSASSSKGKLDDGIRTVPVRMHPCARQRAAKLGEKHRAVAVDLYRQ
jgi:hypothetical protein